MKFPFFLKYFKDEEIERKISFLHSTKLFEKIPLRNIIYVLDALQERSYVKGETVFSEGEIGRALFIVSSGRIDLFRNAPDGSKKKISSISPGEFFGEMALLEERPRTTTAIAGEDSRVFLLFKIKLEALLYSKPSIGVIISTQLAKIISARLREMLDDIEQKAGLK